MKKYLLPLVLLFFVLPKLALAIEPFQVSLPGPFGGSAEVSCQDVHDYGAGDFGGTCSLTYNNFSTIPGYYFTGNMELGFSLLGGMVLWLDFSNSFQIKDDNGNTLFTVEFPDTVSFKIDLINKRVTDVTSFGGDSEPKFSINGDLVVVTPNILDYLFPLM